MGVLHNIEAWSISRHPKWLTLPRVALGIFLIAKGISFISNTVSLELLLAENNMSLGNTWLPVFITWLHLICGFMIIIGLFTRFATLLMIPILLGAVIFINAPKGIFAADTELGFSIAILLLLIFFFLEGGGPLSLDRYLKKHPK